MAVYGGGHCWKFKVLLFQAIKTSGRFLKVWHRLKIPAREDLYNRHTHRRTNQCAKNENFEFMVSQNVKIHQNLLSENLT